MDVVDYQAAIAPLLARFEVDGLDFTELGKLADLLGCPYLVSNNSNWSRSLHTPEQPAANCESVAHATLMRMLHAISPARNLAYSEEKIVLFGLTRNKRWKACLQSEDAAYAFASAILQFLWRFQTGPGASGTEQRYRDTVRADVQPMLSQWLEPADPTTNYVGRSFASAVFGEPWCTFVLDKLQITVFGSDIVTASRPPFLPGLLTCEMSMDAPAILPDMGA